MINDYDLFLEKMESKIPSTIENNKNYDNQQMFIALNDLFNINIALYTMDEKSIVLQSFESELSEFVSKYAIFCYLGDKYIIQSIMRAILESTYRLIYASYYPERGERRIRREQRRVWSGEIGEKICGEKCSHLTKLDKLYGKYSAEIHNDGAAPNIVWHRLKSIGFCVGDNDDQTNDLKTIYECLVNLYPFKIRHEFINASEKLFLKNKLSESAHSLFNKLSA